MNPATMKKHEHLLASGTWDGAYQFTNNCCYDERDEYALIRKTGGQKCGPAPGRDCDKVVRRSDGIMFDMVRGGGAAGQAAQFSQQEGVCKREDYAEPEAYSTQPGPTPQPPSNTVPFHGYDGDEKWKQVGVVLASDYARKPQALDADSVVWTARTIHDCYMGPDASKPPLSLDESIKKHRAEWCAALGVPVV